MYSANKKTLFISVICQIISFFSFLDSNHLISCKLRQIVLHQILFAKHTCIQNINDLELALSPFSALMQNLQILDHVVEDLG
jgi:hypothetical protein